MTIPFGFLEQAPPPAHIAGVVTGPAADAVSELKPGCRIVGMTKGQFSLLDLIRAILDKTGPAHLSLSTWTAGIRDAENAGLLLDAGTLLSVTLLVDRSFATRQPAYCAAVTRRFGKSAIRCTRTHAKVAIIRNGEWNVVVRSSMNLNRNPRFEQFDIDDSAGMADFFGAHFDEMAQAMPEGAHVATREVDAVFERVSRGMNPFDEQPPLPVPAPELRAWADRRCAERRTALWKVAKKVGATTKEAVAAMKDPTAHESLARDIVAVLSK